MGIFEALLGVKARGKKTPFLRSFFCRLRASLKKIAKSGTREKMTFQYDPSSYALNFDDGEVAIKPHHCLDSTETQWVYVVWVKYGGPMNAH